MYEVSNIITFIARPGKWTNVRRVPCWAPAGVPSPEGPFCPPRHLHELAREKEQSQVGVPSQLPGLRGVKSGSGFEGGGLR